MHVQCSSACTSSSVCAGWNLIKVTPTSGQRGKSPLCQLYGSSQMPRIPPFYHSDGNFVCGTKKQLQPIPPPQPGPGGNGNLPSPRSCVSVIATNGSSIQFCSGGNATSLQYSQLTNSSATWTLTLRTAGVMVELMGNISVGPCATLPEASELQWTLLQAKSQQVEVRAVDLEFPFIGHSSPTGVLHLTHQRKRWCPPGQGCEEWSGGGVSCRVGQSCGEADRESQISDNSGSYIHIWPHCPC